jgi:DNA-binding transcriptional MerR regulator
MRYRIGEFAKLGGATIKALRHYDAIGVLCPAHIDARTRYRFYAPMQLRELAAIHALQEMGASLEEIRTALAGGPPYLARRRLLERMRRRAHHSLAATRLSLEWIERELEGMDEDAAEVAVVLRRRAGVRVASIRASLDDYEQIGRVESDLRRGLHGARVGALKGVLWHRCAASGAIEGEPFVEVCRETRCAPGIQFKELPDVTVASAFCASDDAAAVKTYDVIDRWIHAHELKLDGPKREIYVGSILEIQFPVRPL